MICKVSDVVKLMEKLAPSPFAESWDNVGLLAGSMVAPVERIMVTLDVSADTIEHAIGHNVDMIISHHPVIFSPMKAINDKNIVSKNLLSVIKAGISVFCAHTNLDKAKGGMDDALAKGLGLRDIKPLTPFDNALEPTIGRLGVLAEPTSLKEYLLIAKKALNAKSVSYIGDDNRLIETVASCAGAGGDFIEDAASAGADLFITGEMKHNELVASLDLSTAVAQLGHYETEMPGVDSLIKHLQILINDLQYNIEIIPANDYYYKQIQVLEE